MAADTVAGYILWLLHSIEFKQKAYALDRDSRRAALDHFLTKAGGGRQARMKGQHAKRPDIPGIVLVPPRRHLIIACQCGEVGIYIQI